MSKGYSAETGVGNVMQVLGSTRLNRWLTAQEIAEALDTEPSNLAILHLVRGGLVERRKRTVEDRKDVWEYRIKQVDIQGGADE